MTTAAIGVREEVEALRLRLEALTDPAYEAGMRRVIPSSQPAHAVRVPEIRKLLSVWVKDNRLASPDHVFELADALWDTGWREERLLAIGMLGRSKPAFEALTWDRVERWVAGIDNWEHVDHLADLTGRLLRTRPELLPDVQRLAIRDHPWSRRLALVTLIVAARAGCWHSELVEMTERLKRDPHPLVRRAVVWARRELAK